jgi:hypothetical protein
VSQIRRINCHPVKSDEDRAPDSISGSEDWLSWNGELDGPEDSEDYCTVDVEYMMGYDNIIEDLDCPEQQILGAAPNIARLIRPKRESMIQAQKLVVMVNAI